MTNEEFIKSNWCQSGWHCEECRTSGTINFNINEKFPNLKCPLDIENDPLVFPVEKIIERQESYIKNKKFNRKTPNSTVINIKCKHAQLHSTLAFNNAPCKGRTVTCNKHRNKCLVVYEKFCVDNCKYFKKEGE